MLILANIVWDTHADLNKDCPKSSLNSSLPTRGCVSRIRLPLFHPDIHPARLASTRPRFRPLHCLIHLGTFSLPYPHAYLYSLLFLLFLLVPLLVLHLLLLTLALQFSSARGPFIVPLPDLDLCTFASLLTFLVLSLPALCPFHYPSTQPYPILKFDLRFSSTFIIPLNLLVPPASYTYLSPLSFQLSSLPCHSSQNSLYHRPLPLPSFVPFS